MEKLAKIIAIRDPKSHSESFEIWMEPDTSNAMLLEALSPRETKEFAEAGLNRVRRLMNMSREEALQKFLDWVRTYREDIHKEKVNFHGHS